MAMQMMQNASQGAYRLRGAFQQDTVRDFLYQVPTRQVNSHTGLSVGPQVAPTVTRQFQKGLCTSAFTVNNRSGSAGVLGYGYCWQNGIWVAGLWTDVGAVFTDDTAAAQNPTAADFEMTTPAAGEAATDGWVIASQRPFSWVSVDVATASTGNTTFAVGYSNAAGTGWTALTANQPLVDQMTLAATVIPTGEQIFAWNPPSNWGRIAEGQAAVFGTIPAGYYAWRVTIDAASITQTPVATAIEIGSMIFSPEAVADNSSMDTDNVSYVDYDAIGVVALIPAATIGSNVDFYVSAAG